MSEWRTHRPSSKQLVPNHIMQVYINVLRTSHEEPVHEMFPLGAPCVGAMLGHGALCNPLVLWIHTRKDPWCRNAPLLRASPELHL